MAIAFKKAEREQVKIKIALHGPAGSGKTEGALMVARQLVGPRGRIAAIDTEKGAMSLYGDRYDFDVINLDPPFESKYFADALDLAVAGGYDVVVIDSLSHQWEGPGSIKDRKDREEQQQGARANGFALWNKYKAEHRRFFDKLLQADIHVIACFRAREEHAQGVKDGKKVVEKLGMAPITGEGVEYEFRLVWALDMNHWASPSKDNTGLFDGRFVNLRSDRPGEELARWLASGKAAAVSAPVAPVRTSAEGVPTSQSPARSGATAPPPVAAEMTLEEARLLPLMGQAKNWGGNGGKPIGTLPASLLDSARTFFEGKSREAAAAGEAVNPRRAQQIEAITLVLDGLESAQGTLPIDTPAPVSTGGQVDMPPAGRIEDALAAATTREAARVARETPAEAPVPVGIGADDSHNSRGTLPEFEPPF